MPDPIPELVPRLPSKPNLPDVSVGKPQVPEMRVLFDGSKSRPTVTAISENGLQIMQSEGNEDKFVRLQDGGYLNVTKGVIEDVYTNPQDQHALESTTIVKQNKNTS
jgi:hypothetical protein